MNDALIDDPESLSQKASEFLRAGLVPLVQHTGTIGSGVTVKFTWQGQNFEVGLRPTD